MKDDYSAATPPPTRTEAVMRLASIRPSADAAELLQEFTSLVSRGLDWTTAYEIILIEYIRRAPPALTLPWERERMTKQNYAITKRVPRGGGD